MSPSEAADLPWLATVPGPAPKGAGPPVQQVQADDRMPSPDRARNEEGGARFLDRELSWLDFNARVLDLAADTALPLLERVKFCGIFSSNLDEFFMIRVAGLLRQAALTAADSKERETLAQVRTRVHDLVERQARIWLHDLQPALAKHEIVVAAIDDLNEEEGRELEQRFEFELYPLLTPLAVGPAQPFPHLPGLSLNIALLVRDPDSGEVRLARVNVPDGVPRFTAVGSRGLRVPLEWSIAHFLPRLFPQMDVLDLQVVRVTRDADFEIAEEADDILEAVALELRRRRFGEIVRLELSGSASPDLTCRLVEGLGVADERIYVSPSPLALHDLGELSALDRPELKYTPWSSRTPPRLAEGEGADDIFAAIRRGDLLVHHPYDSFSATFERFVNESAGDSGVSALKTSVYRTSDDSPLVPALIEVAERGRQSVCLVELKARFDEQRNIDWSRALERAGVHVCYGFSDHKIHAKTTLVVRKEGDALRRYVHVGTGNYHAGTALSYEDFGLFTADDAIAADVSEFFNHITGFAPAPQFRKILVAPYNLRDRLVEEIRRVALAAAAGEPARIRLKTNALTDQALIEELYAASQAGAVVDVVARSICTLRPGVDGLSENVRVRSVLGHFLEHSRVFLFDAGKRSMAYIGSADLMTRNLDHRIEIALPIEDATARAQLEDVFGVLLADNTAWILGPDGVWERGRAREEAPRHSQRVLMQRATPSTRHRAVRPRAALIRPRRLKDAG
jgi:polyphosphate kinase